MEGDRESARVPMKMGEFSVMDTEFDNIKDRFDSEMRRMEDEMNKFRSELISRQADTFRKTSTREVKDESSLLPGVSGAMGGHSAWLRGLKSPLIKDEDGSGSKELNLRFDVSEYAPEEIMVKTVDNKLLVHAKHEEASGGKSVYREYNREFLLPHGTNPELIRSSLSKVARARARVRVISKLFQDGILTVEAPLPSQAIENN